MNNVRQWIELWLSRIPNNLEIRPLAQKSYLPVKALFSRQPGEIEAYIRKHQNCHLFFGVAGREGHKGDKQNVTELHCLWVDMDFKHLPEGRMEADGILATFDLQPTLTILSGGGYHVYWFLDAPTRELALAERILEGLARRLKADPQSAEIARVLRVPYTKNWKYTPARQITVIRYEPENEYALGGFRQWELKDASGQPQETKRDDWFAHGTRDKDLHYIGCRLVEGGSTPDAVYEVLTRLVRSWGENDPRWVAAKAKAAIKTISKERSGLERRIRDYVEKTTGQFSLAAMAQWLNLTTGEKQECLPIITALHRANELVRVGDQHGVFRTPDTEPCIMDLDAPPRDDVGISLPLNLDTLVVLFPKNVVVVAGEKDSGKTTFAMNTAFMNRDILPVTYFNSEMGVEELQARIRHFPQNLYPFDEWKKIRWIERASRFEDLVDPDGLNIIDFLEIGSEAFTVTEDVKRVFDKLYKGLLLIVMQKRSYKDFAVGGEGTLEKARLAVNLEHGTGGENVCRITVAKNWTGVISAPRGYMCQYKIWQGGEMKKVGEWYRPEKQQEKSKRKGFEGT
jgi:hypothetical protein